MMNYLSHSIADGATNMATDEALLLCCTTPILRTYDWIIPTVSLGKAQAATDILPKVPFIRRPTGGRAVYHDSQSEITYGIVKKTTDQKVSYQENCAIIINLLEKIDIKANLATNGDILVKKKKIAGNAQVYQNGSVLQHGTLLIEQQEYRKAARVLRITAEALKKQTTYLNEHITITKKEVEKLFKQQGKARELEQKEREIRDILLTTKYQTKEWNQGGVISKGACYTQ